MFCIQLSYPDVASLELKCICHENPTVAIAGIFVSEIKLQKRQILRRYVPHQLSQLSLKHNEVEKNLVTFIKVNP